jgi:hypothetical protein
MRSSKVAQAFLPVFLLTALSAGVLPKIDLPKDSPVTVVSADFGDSNAIRVPAAFAGSRCWSWRKK